ncbi:hypothetical protein [Paraburkholderia susongensis]|uniref:Uncharacterized protein n=1 Tax=Paraburkholderia susongensis TaxID=1515439 RepID=A0A1X7LM71_9BURK|nr:hypothetical protein [Paraburkholderia susongensis]SMG54996.1 hypothetical protein SAMN06265784_10782 [Paraburkholderia susongensis]
MTIANTLEQFGSFHDWYIDMLATSKEGNASTPNTLTLGLHDQNRRAILTFRGVTRASIVDGGLLNIVNAIEVLKPDNEAYPTAMAMLKKSAHFGKHHTEYVVYVFSTVGLEIAVEFDELSVESV